MTITKFLSTAAVAALLVSGAASAATFTIDAGDINVSGGDFCFPGNCILDGAIAGGSFDLSNVGDTASLNDLFDWNVILSNNWASGAGAYSVNATLNFSSPSAASTSGAGYAGFVTLLGSISAGALHWTSGTGSVSFDEGYVLGYSFHDALELGFGTGATTGASFTLTEAPAPIPLPASALLLVAGVGALGAVRAKRCNQA